ncbi:cytochrome P450 monooxygenase pc-3 [Hymenopellis radicata]|nr:cytochrome P450 monooxygenase pc-3 [Hymenopellis radicata]
MVPPGIKFLFFILLRLGAVIAFVSFLPLSIWVRAGIVVFGAPSAFVLRISYQEFQWKRDAAASGARLPPRVLGKRIGNIDVLKRMLNVWASGYLGDYLTDHMHALGSLWDMHVLWDNMYLTTSPQHIQIMLATDFANFQKGALFQEAMNSVLGTGVFNADGDMWKFHRSMTRPFFSRDRITHFELYDRHAETVVSRMKERFRAGYSVDFQDLISRFTMDAATEFLFGTCVNSLASKLPYPYSASSSPLESSESNDFAKAFLMAQDILADRQHWGWIWPLVEIRKDRTEEHMRVVRSFIDPIINSALEKKHSMGTVVEKKDEIGGEDTLLDHLIGMTSDAKVIKDETLNILLAGRDTTAATLTFVIYFLSMYPTIMTRLREEILGVVGPERAPTFEDVKNMKFLRAVINETLRLCPVVPFNIRESINATTLPAENPMDKPYYIPPRTGVAYSVFMMHRRTDLWGPDAEEFDPDRFLDARLKKYILPNPFIFLPFNAGPRICLGQQFAYNEISFMLVRLLQNFASFSLDEDAFHPSCRPPSEWAACPGRKGIDRFCPRTTLTMYSAGGMWVKAAEAAA